MEPDRPSSGWIVVAAATGLSIIFGIFFSFGVFLDPLIAEFGWSSALTAFVFGVGYGAYVPMFPLLTRRSFGMRSYGVVYGVISSGVGVGGLLVPPVLGGILSSATGSYFLTFVLAGLFSLVAAAMALLMRFQDGSAG